MIKKISFLFLISAFLIVTSCKETSKSELKKVASVDKVSENLAPITPKTALQSYLNNGDKNFKWELKESYPVGETTAYDLLLTSQKWREHLWTHQLTVFVPKKISYDGVLLFITGGSEKGDIPNWTSKEDKTAKTFANIATKDNAITAIVRQVPKQPLYNGLVEDQLISFTLHNFKKDKDYSWPLLFPMVKSAVSAMTAIQEFTQKNLKQEISRFTISGRSKRGWTTWLTGASDKRVEAIAPMVIDVLNMPVNIDYQIEAWHEYSIQIEDYTKLEIPQTAHTKDGDAITQMVDPYAYRKKLTMPKLIFIGTNDEYWPVDAIKNYIDSIPGENYIHYVPNAGHSLAGGKQAYNALSSFWEKTLEKKPYNELNYHLSYNKSSATLTVNSSSKDLLNIYFWSANSKDRDFRDEKWSSIKMEPTNKKETTYKINFPKNGFKAFYMDMEYADPNGGKYTKSTRMYLTNNNKVLL